MQTTPKAQKMRGVLRQREERRDTHRELDQLHARATDHVGRCMTLMEQGLQYWQQRDPSAALIIAAAQAVAAARIAMFAGAAMGEPAPAGAIPAEIGWTGAILEAARDSIALVAEDDPGRPACVAALDQLRDTLADVVTANLTAGLEEGISR